MHFNAGRYPEALSLYLRMERSTPTILWFTPTSRTYIWP